MRLLVSLLAAVAVVALVGCAGDEGGDAEPLSVAQRFVTAEEAPESKPDPDETRQTTVALDEYIGFLSEGAVDLDPEEAREVFEETGFAGAGVDTRFYGEVHTPGESTHVVSAFVEVDSEDGATRALDYLEDEAKKPCPMSCATQISTFEVDDIDGARGIHRVATAEDIERVGTADQAPFESYWVAFTDGALVYTVDLFGRPGSVSEEQALEIASAYHHRLTAG